MLYTHNPKIVLLVYYSDLSFPRPKIVGVFGFRPVDITLYTLLKLFLIDSNNIQYKEMGMALPVEYI